MGKTKSLFFCKECGTETSRWFGQCPSCHAWSSLVEAPSERAGKAGRGIGGSGALRKPLALSEVSREEEERTTTGMGELDRVLGGGIVKGSLVLVGGDPGIGKSTLLLQMCRNLSAAGKNVLYVSGEESLGQIKMRAVRIGEFSDSLKLLSETNLDDIIETILSLRPEIVIIDSIQTMVKPDVESAAGAVGQVREVTSALLRVAKEEEISIFIIGHVTKEGTVAGPRMLEHMVDTVLYFEGEQASAYRLLRAVKNRFGSTNEIGVFEMIQSGLREVLNPSEHMLMGMPDNEPGSVITVTLEGTRPILVEVQALICRTIFNFPKRTAAGTDFNRVNLLMAVMEKKLGPHLSECDAYINVAGGMRITEPALDLGIGMAILSGYLRQEMPEKTAVFGEIGLTGEVRSVSQAQKRVKEAAKLGLKRVILPETNRKQLEAEFEGEIELTGISNIRELSRMFRTNKQE